MKKIAKKSILQKTIIAILIALLLSNFIVPTYSHAGEGGIFADGLIDLVSSLGDVVINLLQRCMTGEWGAGFKLKGGFLIEAKEFFDSSSSKYEHMKTTEKGEPIDPDDKENGFSKVLRTGKEKDYYIPIATYSPEQIFAGKVPGLDINFIDPNTDMDGDGIEDKNKDGEYLSSAAKLQPTIATWYVALRNLTVVGLLSVLVYVGIRIIISSTAGDKAKYKQMLMDWIVALCLVFFLHYIMSFTLTLTQSISEAIAGDGSDTVIITIDGENESFKTNLLGAARFKTQYEDFGQRMAYLIMYLALVIYTVLFTWFYLKRLLMMAFLTLIAPVVALTYPIDKISDGKAQAFDMWLKEYIFNALIQPFHLIIYTVFVGSAMDLASTNIIYMIAALAFIFPAEKILRKFFGFEKAGAGTLGALAGGFTAASLLKGLGKGKGGGGKSSGGKQVEEGNKPPRFENKHDISEIGDGNTIPSGGASAADANQGNEQEDPVRRMEREALTEKVADGQIAESELTADQRRLLGLDNNNNNNRNNSNNSSSTTNNNTQGNSRFTNWRRQRINRNTVGRAIKGVAKFGTRTAFKAGAGTLAGAVALASGAGFAGAATAVMAGSNVGGRLGDAALNLGSKAIHGVGRVGGATNQLIRGNTEGAADTLLGGTALGRELDIANGNSRYQDAGSVREFKQNENNIQYLRDLMAAQRGGNIPSMREVKDKMNSFDPYLAEGLTDIKDMLKAQKAELYTNSSKQAAIIAAIGKERGITADILNDSKKAEAHQANLKQDFINKGYSQADAAKQANYTMNILKVQNGVAHNMQKPQQPKIVQPPKQSKPPRTKK